MHLNFFFFSKKWKISRYHIFIIEEDHYTDIGPSGVNGLNMYEMATPQWLGEDYQIIVLITKLDVHIYNRNFPVDKKYSYFVKGYIRSQCKCKCRGWDYVTKSWPGSEIARPRSLTGNRFY